MNNLCREWVRQWWESGLGGGGGHFGSGGGGQGPSGDRGGAPRPSGEGPPVSPTFWPLDLYV